MMRDEMAASIGVLMDAGADFCDIQSQSLQGTTVRSINGRLRDLDDRSAEGLRVRVWKGGRWAYASSVQVDKESLRRCCEEAMRNVRGDRPSIDILAPVSVGDHHARVGVEPTKVPLEEKVAAVLDLDAAQKMEGVLNRIASYSEETKGNILLNSAGSDVSWNEVRTRFRAMSVAADGSRVERYYDGPDGCRGFELVKETDIEALGRMTALEAVAALKAVTAPSGLLTVISDPMVTGLLAHEVIGHAAEADEVVKGRSFLSGKVGEAVASPLVSLADDGSLPYAHGSLPFDDEGSPSGRTDIIRDGIYSGYINDLVTANAMGVDPSGNGRAQDFGRRTWVRMTNTFIEPGESSLEEIISETGDGILCDKMVNGMEDPVGGGFEAKVLRGFIIRDGEVQGQVRSFTLTGQALEILRTVDMVGDRLELDGGMCGKGIEDWVNVSSGGPFLRSRIIVGGG